LTSSGKRKYFLKSGVIRGERVERVLDEAKLMRGSPKKIRAPESCGIGAKRTNPWLPGTGVFVSIV